MIRIFKTEDGAIHQIDEAEAGCWIALTNPTATEILEIAERYEIDPDHVRAPLDEEERSRIEVEDHYTLILVDIPMIEERNDKEWYGTIPMGIVVTDDKIFTVCLEDTPVLSSFMDGRVRNFFTYKRTRFILQILYRNASRYLQYLRQIDKKTNAIETELQRTLRNQELMQLMRLEKSLVFFATSLKSNEIVLEKLLRSDLIRRFPDDEDLLEDVIIENKQAIEMCAIYRDILSSSMDAFSSVISNNVNDIMKVLTSLTLVLSIPTLIASIWGMNVKVPFEGDSVGFWILLGASLLASIISIVILSKRRML